MEASDQIIKVLDALCQKFGVVVDWSQQNVLPYVQDLGKRIASYEIWTSVAWIVVFLLTILLLEIARRTSLKKHNEAKDDYGYDDSWIFFAGLCVVAMIVMSAFIAAQCFDIIQAIVLPEKTWLEFIKEYNK